LMKTAKHYFHWELEFPDIFFRTQNHTKKHSQNNGFDIVIANPPYLNSRDMVREFEHKERQSKQHIYSRKVVGICTLHFMSEVYTYLTKQVCLHLLHLISGFLNLLVMN